MKEEIKDKISTNSKDNIAYIKELLKDNSDIVYREFLICKNLKGALVYVDGMADKLLLNDYVLESLMLEENEIVNAQEIKDKILSVSDLREVDKLSKGIDAFLSGDTILFIDSLDKAYVLATRFWPARGVAEPSGETVVRGSREGFTETIRFNTALVRRRIRDTRFKIKAVTLGVRSKTDTAIMYIDDIVRDGLVEEVENRISKINIDAVLDSGYVEQLIEDNKKSIFPQIQSTERPDVVAAALYEGRVAIMVDNSPFALIVPTTLPNLFQSPDDYYQRWISSTLVRIIRIMGIVLSIIMPALYVAVTSFHTDIIPTKLAYSIAATREGVPFPAFIEAIIMEISLAFLMESIVRLPKPIGATIGIVGGLIIGQAAVSAGIVSPIMIIIVAVTAITSFMTPNYEVSSAFRIVRFLLIIAAAIIGLYGIVLGLVILLVHLVKLKSFGIAYLSPAVNFNTRDFKDFILKFPIDKMKKRPRYMRTKDKIRQK
ncbi:spore germination protein [Haloimpatiens lingqiaonensis]|uniref:spore germination protein n=1 Tax=Haloimpatiens lingqiaonensis TaxID=1380675 RepID=UPI0010FDACBC|nr:spore germination protein [Haloimpatiens lingqiaonensis]